MNSRNLIKVICIGNSLVADDGFGPAVYDYFKERSFPKTTFSNLALGGLDLLSEFCGEQVVIVVDAVNTGCKPGTLTVTNWDDIRQASGTPVTSHDIGLIEVIKIGLKVYPEKMPNQVVLVGVEGYDFSTVGLGLSDAVTSTLPKALIEIERLITNTLKGDKP